MKVKLGEVCIFQRGQTITKKDVIDGDVPVIAGGKQPAYYHNKANREKNIITISSSGANAGYVNFWTVPIFCSDSFTVKPKDDNQFIIRYLYYFLKSRQEYLYSLSRGCGIPHVYSSDIAPFEIELVDIQTQKEIVAVLDKVTSLISMRREQLEKLDILVKSKFIEMFGDPVLNPKGWEKKKLGEVCDQIRGITYKSQDVEESLNSNSIMLLRANNISNDGTINYDNIIFINKNKVNSIQFIKRNDILVCASSGSVHLVGKAAQIKEYKLLTFGAFCKVVRPKNINPIYIGQFFQSAYYRKTISTLAQGANINNIRNEDIDNITIPIPPLDLQNQFAEFVEQVEKNREKIKSSLNQLETLYSALMQEYFG